MNYWSAALCNADSGGRTV